MDVVSQYPFGGPGSIMQDATASTSLVSASSNNNNNGGRLNKRRRVDNSRGTDDAPGYQDTTWTDDAPTASSSRHNNHNSNNGNEPSFPPAAAAGDFAASAANAASALPGTTEGSSWQQGGVSAYPDLASYGQQPYFYGHNGNNNNPASSSSTTVAVDHSAYNSAWQSNSQPYPDAPVVSYSVADSTSATSMPYFPSANAVTAGESTDLLDTANAFPFDSQPAAEYAPYTQPSATAALAQREAAKSSAYYFDDASMHLKIQSLPILDNLATQLIHTISKASFPQIQDLMASNDSEDSQAYKTLKDLFDQTRKVYSRETAFIDAIAIQMFQPNQQEIIRKANIATFISSILGAHDVSFFHLNEFFMETFVPLGHRLLKWQGAIYLELKTQIYISALMNSDGSPEAMLDELFPPDLDAQILTRHPDAPSLSPSEQDFIDRSRARKSYLLAEPSSHEALRELPKKYQWSDFVREFASCITKNVDGIMNVPVRSQGGAGGSSKNSDLALNGTSNSGGIGIGSNSKSGGSGGGEGRKAAAAASTIRQPWTKPEEDALLSGLERVNGPHWSQILALYGRGGSVSEVLKDRNQVQLKDKARNLKLWYLKTGKEVPPALRGVTGELRKRGGARARAALGITDDDDQGADDEPGESAGEKGSGKPKKKKSKK